MAVSTTNKIDPPKLLSALGLSFPGHLEVYAGSDQKAVFKCGTETHKSSMAFTALVLAQIGGLAPMSAQMAKDNVKKVLDLFKTNDFVAVDGASIEEKVAASLAEAVAEAIDNSLVSGFVPETQPVKQAKAKAKEKATLEGVVKLTHATSLKQSVLGTSASSVYHVIAIGPAINVAIRFNNLKISVRAELRPKFPFESSTAEKKRLLAAGFDQKSGYFSLHLGCDNELLVRKTVGSILFAIGEDWEQVLPWSDIAKPKLGAPKWAAA